MTGAILDLLRQDDYILLLGKNVASCETRDESELAQRTKSFRQFDMNFLYSKLDQDICLSRCRNVSSLQGRHPRARP